MHRIHGMPGWALLIALLLSGVSVPARGAETFGYTSRKPQLWETERPLLEYEPGKNLFWHDPYLGNWEMCRAWPASANGCAPKWYVRGEMLALWRDADDSHPFATVGPAGPVVLSTAEFKPEFRAGVRALVGRSLGEWYRVEASYFGSHSWSDRAAVWNTDANGAGGIGNLYSPFSQFGDPVGVVGFDYNTFASIRFESRLNNGEVNLRRRILMRPGSYEASFLVGGRYLDISEQFDYHTYSALPGPLARTNDVNTDTRNKLIGFQIGLLGQFLIQPRCWIDFEMKGGIYQNRASLDRVFTVTEIGGQTSSIPGEDTHDRTSLVGDLSLQFNYQFSPGWTFYAGYNAIWVTGVALAANNFETDISLLAVGPALINHGGQVVYHGPNFGLVFAW